MNRQIFHAGIPATKVAKDPRIVVLMGNRVAARFAVGEFDKAHLFALHLAANTGRRPGIYEVEGDLPEVGAEVDPGQPEWELAL